MLSYIIGALALGLIGVIAFIFFLKRGQFDDVEEIKYEMIRTSDDHPKD